MNYFFSNGLLDPWSSGGVLKSLSSSIRALLIPDGAHHLDLRASHPNDTPSVIHARKTIKHWITKWIFDYRYRKQTDDYCFTLNVKYMSVLCTLEVLSTSTIFLVKIYSPNTQFCKLLCRKIYYYIFKLLIELKI